MVPEQTDGLAPSVIVGFGFTIIVTSGEVAVLEVKHVPPVMLISEVTTSLFVSVVEVNVAEAEFCSDAPLTLKS